VITLETAWNTFGKEPPPSKRDNRQEEFEQHCERMKLFRKSHDPAHTGAEALPPEYQQLLSTLRMVSYILNLVREQSAVTLPQNWQN
jgi:hypothetical protein